MWKYSKRFFILIIWIVKIRFIRSFASEILCNRIPGLSQLQRQLCTESPDAMIALGAGHLMGAQECQYQFKGHRWNCSQVWQKDVFGQIMYIGSREAAYTYAITSAGAVHYITAACARGNISLCGCDTIQRNHFSYQLQKRHQQHEQQQHAADYQPWKWGGCSADISFGLKFARKFLDAREIEKDARSLMNLHNNRAGRKIVKNLLRTECKCHGVSGSCAMKTCWKSLPPFRVIGDALMKKYNRAKMVQAIHDRKPATAATSSGSSTNTASNGLKLIISKKLKNLKNFNYKNSVMPKRMELVYIESSPNYCEKNVHYGSMGTINRSCNRTAIGIDGCDLLCCGRGYNTHQISRTWQCNCKFKWCCQVQCEICHKSYEEYTCK